MTNHLGKGLGKRVVFLGAGNMAEALVAGILNGGLCLPSEVTVSDVDAARRHLFASTLGVQAVADNAEAVRDADVIVLAVKPQVMAVVLAELRGKLPAAALVISIAAGITTRTIEAGLGGNVRVVRVMPNTPCLVRCGASAVAPGSRARETDLATAEQLMGSTGIVVRVAEKDMDAVTALSGSGPAYFFYFIEAMLTVAEEMHLDASTARRLAVATMEGAARLLAESEATPAELRGRVTSKGGTTAAAVAVLEERAVGPAIQDALLAAMHRSRELAAS